MCSILIPRQEGGGGGGTKKALALSQKIIISSTLDWRNIHPYITII